MTLRALLVTLVAALTAIPSSARADENDKLLCISSAEAAQQFRRDHKFVDAARELETCRRASCPEVVRVDCNNWLREIGDAAPTIALRVRATDGDLLTGGRVTVDGVLRVQSFEGRPIILDPGVHDVAYEDVAGHVVQARMTVRADDRNLPISLVATANPALEPRHETHSATRARSAVTDARPVPAITWILGGAAILTAASFATFGTIGSNEADDLRKSCAPKCRENQLDAPRTKFIIADTSLVLSALALSGAVVTFVLRPTRADSRTLSVGGAPMSSGGSAWIRGSF